MKPNLASAMMRDDDSAEDAEAPDSEPGEAADPFTQAAELAFEACQDGDKESFVDALRNAMKLHESNDESGPKKKPVLISKLGGKG